MLITSAVEEERQKVVQGFAQQEPQALADRSRRAVLPRRVLPAR
jgi:hypothetical protein